MTLRVWAIFPADATQSITVGEVDAMDGIAQ